MEKTFAGKQFVFAGNRFFVLEAMLNASLNVCTIYAMPGSYLQKELEKRHLPYKLIESKKGFVESLMSLSFDYFVSNGLPVILPIAKLSEGNSKKFINVHPSYLPDLRGADPVPGALLFGRDSGATCHYMNDTIDGGDIIEQVKIKYSKDFDCGLLYQLSFIAEREVFEKALARSFEAKTIQTVSGSDLYYTVKEEDKRIDFAQDAEVIFRQIKAFNTRSQGAYFFFNDEKVTVRGVEILDSPYLLQAISHAGENEVVFAYESKILVKKGDVVLALDKLEGNTTGINKTEKLL